MIYDLKKLDLWQKPSIYTLIKLTFVEVQRYTVW